MKRVNFHLTGRQLERLRKLSESRGLAVAELIRRAVDAWLDRQEKKERGDGREP
jgi:Arc/MetJ-type ribon-helix-helix transcriptional regulator